MIHRILYSKNMCERYEYMCTTKTLTAQLHNNISHHLIQGPHLPRVWYRGRGHVECRRVYGSSYVRISLCSLGVFLVTVCIEMNWLQSHCFLTESISHFWFVCVSWLTLFYCYTTAWWDSTWCSETWDSSRHCGLAGESWSVHDNMSYWAMKCYRVWPHLLLP